MAQFFIRLATCSLFAVAFVFGVSAPAEAQRVGLVWAGANYNTPSQNQIIGNEVIKSRVQWVLMDIVWAPLEEHAPTPSCQPANGPDCYYGPHSAGYHNYNFTLLDQNISQLHNAGIQVGIRIDAPPPIWSAGNLCEGGCNGYGVIMSDHYTTFKNAIYDLYYNLASRYKNTANFWAIWNEPNSIAFSPQILEDGYLTDEYMTLIQFPAHNALTAVIPTATIIGPEFAVPADGNDGPSCDYWGHCINWLNGWTYSMLNYFDGFFPTFTFHSYPTYGSLGPFN